MYSPAALARSSASIALPDKHLSLDKYQTIACVSTATADIKDRFAENSCTSRAGLRQHLRLIRKRPDQPVALHALQRLLVWCLITQTRSVIQNFVLLCPEAVPSRFQDGLFE